MNNLNQRFYQFLCIALFICFGLSSISANSGLDNHSEDRRIEPTKVTIPTSPGNLTISDRGDNTRSSSIKNDWILSVEGSNYILTDKSGSAMNCAGCDGDGTSTIQFARKNIRSITVEGGAGDDILTIQEKNGLLPQPVESAVGFHSNVAFEASGLGNGIIGIHFEGGAGWDELVIEFEEAHDVTYFSDENETKSGIVDVSGSFTLSFDGLEPIVLVGAGGSLTVDASASPATTTLTLSDLVPAVDGVNQIVGDGGFETTTFSGFATLTIRGGDGSETIICTSIDGADPDGMGPGAPLSMVTLDGDNTVGTDVADDLILLENVPAAISVTLLGGDGNDVFSVGSPLRPSLALRAPGDV